MLLGVGVHRGWPENGRKMAREVARKIAAAGAQACREGWFGVIFASLIDSIKTIHELESVSYITSTHLAEKVKQFGDIFAVHKYSQTSLKISFEN